MPDPNPYEPPREPESLTEAQAAKRGIGVGAILLLTPFAVGIATAGSCAAVDPVVNSIPGPNYALAFFVFWTVFLGPPAVVLGLMLGWAAWTARRSRQ